MKPKRHLLFHGFPRFFHALPLITIFFLGTCNTGMQTEDRSETGRDLLDLSGFIEQLTPEGWTLYDEVAVFSAENLYESINGRAELYLAYDVITLTTATYERKGSVEDFIEISIYDMGDPANAFGIFSVERTPGETPLKKGRISYISDANCYIWKGNYYIAVVASNSTEEFKSLSTGLAVKVTSHLTDSGEAVWGITAFPPEDLIPDSIQYFKVDAMGLDFMKETFTAKYMRGDDEVTVIVSQKSSVEEAARTVDQYLNYSEDYGHGNTQVTKNGLDLFVCDIGGAFDVIFQKDRTVCGVISVQERDEAIASAAHIFEKFQF